MKKAKTVDEYIADAPEAARPLMEELRKVIKTTIPQAEERIAWNAPNYKLNGVLTGFAVFSKHISIGFSEGGLSDEEREMFTSKGYKTGKGTVQIKFNQEVPVEEIKLTLLNHANLE